MFSKLLSKKLKMQQCSICLDGNDEDGAPLQALLDALDDAVSAPRHVLLQNCDDDEEHRSTQKRKRPGGLRAAPPTKRETSCGAEGDDRRLLGELPAPVFWRVMKYWRSERDYVPPKPPAAHFAALLADAELARRVARAAAVRLDMRAQVRARRREQAPAPA